MSMTDRSSSSLWNRGPLTEILSLPSSCTEQLTAWVYGPEPIVTSWFGGRQYTNYLDPSCYPPWTKPQDKFNNEAWQPYHHSPGICPQGWTAGAHWTEQWHDISIWRSTTAALCCPSGWLVVPNALTACDSYLLPGSTYTGILTSRLAGVYVRGSTTVFTATFAMSLHREGIPILWQQSDSAIFSAAAARAKSTSSSPSSTLLPTKTISSSSDGRSSGPLSPTASYTTIDSQNGLSTGAKIGIGVGIPFLVIFASVIGFILYRRRKTNKSKGTEGLRPVGPSEVPEWVGKENSQL